MYRLKCWIWLDVIGLKWISKGGVGQLASGLSKWKDRRSYCQRVGLSVCTVHKLCG